MVFDGVVGGVGSWLVGIERVCGFERCKEEVERKRREVERIA